MLFLQSTKINLVVIKSSGPKCHAVLLTAPIFAGFCVSHRSWWGGGGFQGVGSGGGVGSIYTPQYCYL